MSRSFLWCFVWLAGCTASKAPELSARVVGHCEYLGPNSELPECKDYLGEWTKAQAEADCATNAGAFTETTACSPAGELGVCLLAKSAAQSRIFIFSSDTSQCGLNRTGCEFFGGGFWEPAAQCGGAADELVVLENPFPMPRRVCRDPKPGEAPGQSANGQICFWEGMHGATEEGREYIDGASCDLAMRQRAYAPAPPNGRWGQPDSRRENPTYLAEETWVKSQVRSQSCTCCHSNAVPSGGAVFGVDREGSFSNQFNDLGLAQAAGWVNSVALGGWPGALNNGFQKSDLEHPDHSIFMSTQPERMKRFFEEELTYRGLSRADFEGKPDGFGPLTEQLNFRPAACEGSEGVSAEGLITWGRGRARYVYVLEASARSPTVPPNLDLPEGTVWRLDVPESGTPVGSGTVRYGVVPEGLSQRSPELGAVMPLVSGRQYYLAVMADVLVPITRCLFTAP
jgi:hypothetical protein